MAHVDVPGEPTQTSTALLETATGMIQSFAPLNKIHQHLCANRINRNADPYLEHSTGCENTTQVRTALEIFELVGSQSMQSSCVLHMIYTPMMDESSSRFHFYAYDMSRQVEAHHYCSHQNEEMRQCLIYDSPDANARLIGVEYLISENLFLTLPDDEKPLWHSHEYEVKSGVLFLPGVPGPVERMDMEKVCKTYGKTIHFWQVDRGDDLPLGPPQLMMALTRDGQLHDDLAKDVEKRFGVSFEKERENRANMTGPEHGIHPLANGAGKGLKMVLREVDLPPASSFPRVFV